MAWWPTAWQVRTGSADDLDLVEPLWVAVHHRHTETMPELAPYVSDEQTWSARRELYEELLTKPDTLLLLAFVDDDASRLRPGARADGGGHVDFRHLGNRRTDRRNRVAQCASGLPRRRAGLTTCSKRLEEHLRDQGVDDLILGVLAGNSDAIRLYERRGYQPTWLYLSRFHGRA